MKDPEITALTQLLCLPDGVVPVSCIALGQPAESKPARSRFDPSYVHHETW